MKHNLARGLLSALVTAALVLGATTFAQTAVEPLDPPQQVRVAYVPILKFATLYVAADRGLFEKYGLDVSIDSVASGTEAIAFLEQGQIDVGGIAIVTSLWNGWNQGIDVRVFAPGGLEPFENSPTRFMVRKDLFDSGDVDTIEELTGRTVALAGGPGSGGEYLAAKALELGGLTIRDVQTLNLANADMPAAFENGSIDAALLGSPYAEQIEADGMQLLRSSTQGLVPSMQHRGGSRMPSAPHASFLAFRLEPEHSFFTVVLRAPPLVASEHRCGGERTEPLARLQRSSGFCATPTSMQSRRLRCNNEDLADEFSQSIRRQGRPDHRRWCRHRSGSRHPVRPCRCESRRDRTPCRTTASARERTPGHRIRRGRHRRS